MTPFDRKMLSDQLLLQDFMKDHLSGLEHAPKVGATQSALSTTAGSLYQSAQISSLGPGFHQQTAEAPVATYTSIDNQHQRPRRSRVRGSDIQLADHPSPREPEGMNHRVRHILGGEDPLGVGARQAGTRQHPGRYRSRTDRDYPDAVLSGFQHQGLAESQHGMFGSGVRRTADKSIPPRQTRNVYNITELVEQGRLRGRGPRGDPSADLNPGGFEFSNEISNFCRRTSADSNSKTVPAKGECQGPADASGGAGNQRHPGG